MRSWRRPRIDENWQPRLWTRLIVLGLLVAYAIAFILQNKTTVSVCFVFVTARVSLIWVILLAGAIGLLGGILLAQLERRRRRRTHETSQPSNPV